MTRIPIILCFLLGFAAPAQGLEGPVVGPAVVEALSGGGLRVDCSIGLGQLEAASVATMERVADQLVELSLAGRRFEASALAKLTSLPQLQHLDLSRTNVSGALLLRLLEAAPALQSLNLHSTGLRDRDLLPLLERSGLKELWLHGTQVSRSLQSRLRVRLGGTRVHGESRLPRDPFARGGPRRILVLDLERSRVALLRARSLQHFELVWERPVLAGEPGIVQVLPGRRILVRDAANRLVLLDGSTGREVRRWVGKKPIERFAGLAEEEGPLRILVDQVLTGSPGSLRPWPRGGSYPDGRVCGVTEQGHLLFRNPVAGRVWEWSPSGQAVFEHVVATDGDVLRPDEIKVGGVSRTAGGRTLMTTGDRLGIVAFDSRNRVAREVDLRPHAAGLVRLTRVQELSTGRWFVVNAEGAKDAPHAIEIDAESRITYEMRAPGLIGRGWTEMWVFEDDRLENRALR